MKNFINISVLFIVLGFLIGCNKDTVDKKSTEKMNEKKEALNEKKNSDTKEASTKTTSDVKLYKVEKVEKQSGKKVAPNFTWTEDGKQMSLKDLKGSVVLLNLWATWCGPCIKEMPDLSQLSDDLKDKDFRLLGLNIFHQEGTKKVEDFLKSSPVTYTILDGNKEIVDALAEANGSPIDAVPTTFIIDKNGKIVETIVGGRNKAIFLQSVNKYIN